MIIDRLTDNQTDFKEKAGFGVVEGLVYLYVLSAVQPLRHVARYGRSEQPNSK